MRDGAEAPTVVEVPERHRAAARARGAPAVGLALALACLPACAAAHPERPGLPWHSVLGRDHPLAGRIWDVAAGHYSDAPTLMDRLVGARFVLLGEKHDNPDHHRLQAWVLRALIAAGRRPAVGFEMFAVDMAPAIAGYLASHPPDATGLGAAVGWERTGWPPWPLYQPIADAALAAGLPIVATNLDRVATQAILRDGLAALDAAAAARLRLDAPLSEQMRAAMAAEIQGSHCNMLPDAMLDGMIAVQRARDAQMAERLATAGERDGAILIAGYGHVRRDRGVPAFLRLQARGARVIGLAFLEVQRNDTEPEAYVTYFGPGPFPVDYVWFTPRLDDVDPCEKFRAPLEHLRKMKKD